MNEENLVPQNERTKEEQREIARMGGKASGASRRKRKTLKEELLLLLENSDTQEKVSAALIGKALKGDVKAFTAIRDTIGEKPIEKIEQTNHTITVDFSDLNNDD